MAKSCVVRPAPIWRTLLWTALLWTPCFRLHRQVSAADTRVSAVTRVADSGETAEITRLVRGLGASTFQARQHSQRSLVEIGLSARPALEAACQDPDQEIRQRARQALAAIKDLDFHVRLGAFLADKDVDNSHGLAGWQHYRSLAGTTPAARQLFADMLRAERELLEAVADDPDRAGALLDSRCQQLESGTQDSGPSRRPQLSLATMAALLFAAGDIEVPVSDHAGECIIAFSGQPALNQALHARPTSEIVRALLGAWVSRPFDRDAVTGYRSLILAMQFNLPDAVAPALALIAAPGAPPHLVQYAILALGKLGGREHLAALEPLLKDERPIGVPDRGGRESDTQVRDVALAAMIHLTGQPLSDYGFSRAKSNAMILFNTNTLGFNDPSAREAALRKWRDWTEKQPK